MLSADYTFESNNVGVGGFFKIKYVFKFNSYCIGFCVIVGAHPHMDSFQLKAKPNRNSKEL